MRKLLAYILSLVLITGFCSVGQSEEKGQEILFRGIPWGSSIEETIRLLKEEFGNDITVDIQFSEDGYKVPNGTHMFYFGPMIKCCLSITNLKVAGYYVGSYVLEGKKDLFGQSDSKTKTIAFYSKNNVVLYFQPILNEDGTDYSREEGMLCRADYIAFVPDGFGSFAQEPYYDNNGTSMKSELIEKLDTLYTSHEESEYTTNFHVFDSNYKITDSETVYHRINEWKKENAYITMVDIKAGYHERVVASVTISYSVDSEEIKKVSSGIREMIRQKEQKQEAEEKRREEEEKEKRGTDGL